MASLYTKALATSFFLLETICLADVTFAPLGKDMLFHPQYLIRLLCIIRAGCQGYTSLGKDTSLYQKCKPPRSYFLRARYESVSSTIMRIILYQKCKPPRLYYTTSFLAAQRYNFTLSFIVTPELWLLSLVDYFLYPHERKIIKKG
jgi:hypothetical protein